MRIHVRVGDETYEVEVGDLGARPVVAVVDGMRFEVWPEEAPAPGESGPPPSPQERRPTPRAQEAAAPPPAEAAAGTCPPSGPGLVRAPIPGVIDSIAAKPGDHVVRGQELVVLEAMKMKNVIKSPRPGTIAAVHVTAGQHVKHGDPLVELQ